MTIEPYLCPIIIYSITTTPTFPQILGGVEWGTGGIWPRKPSRWGWAAHVLPQRPLFAIFWAVWKRVSREGDVGRGLKVRRYRKGCRKECASEGPLAGGAGAVWKRVWGLREYVYAEMRLFTFCQGSICMIMGILMIERRVEIRIP